MNLTASPILYLTNLVNNRCKTHNPINIAEIGVYDGSTTISYLPTLKEYNSHVYIIDWFSGNYGHTIGPHRYQPENKENIKNIFLANVKEIDCENNITILHMHSHIAASHIPNNSLDICFIDGSHAYSDVLQDIKLYLPKVKAGGIICGHDCQDIYQVGGPGSFSIEELESQGHPDKGHVGVMQAVYDMFGDDVLTNIDPIEGGQGCQLWMKQL